MLANAKRKYHERKLREAIEYLYPSDDQSSSENLARIANNETVIGSYIDCCSSALLSKVGPVSSYQIRSVLIAMKGALNCNDDGQSSTVDVDCYEKKWLDKVF